MTSPTAGIDAWTAEQERTAALHRAVYAGDAAVVTALLDAGANINTRDRRGFSPLARAVERRQHKLALLLLEHSADPNTRDRRERTPLYWAAEYGTAEVARALIAHGADPAVGGKTLSRAFHSMLGIAVRSGRAEVAEAIASAEAWKPLPKASDRSCREIARAHFNDALQQAIEHGRVGAVRALLSGRFDILLFGVAGPGAEEERRMLLASCLCDAARLGNVRLIRVLVGYGADVAEAATDGRIPLVEALATSRTDAAALLRELGAPYSVREAVALADLAFLEDAIRRKDFVPGAVDEGAARSLIGQAARSGHRDVIRLLLAYGVAPKWRNGTCDLGLLYAAQSGPALPSRHGWSAAPTCLRPAHPATPRYTVLRCTGNSI